MLPRHLSLKRPEDFQAVKQRGSRWRDSSITLTTLSNGLPHNRYGVVVSKRVGSAVTRNRIKRRIRAAIAHWQPLLPNGYDCVIVVQPSASEADYVTFENALGRGFRHLRLLAAAP